MFSKTDIPDYIEIHKSDKNCCWYIKNKENGYYKIPFGLLTLDFINQMRTCQQHLYNDYNEKVYKYVISQPSIDAELQRYMLHDLQLHPISEPPATASSCEYTNLIQNNFKQILQHPELFLVNEIENSSAPNNAYCLLYLLCCRLWLLSPSSELHPLDCEVADYLLEVDLPAQPFQQTDCSSLSFAINTIRARFFVYERLSTLQFDDHKYYTEIYRTPSLLFLIPEDLLTVKSSAITTRLNCCSHCKCLFMQNVGKQKFCKLCAMDQSYRTSIRKSNTVRYKHKQVYDAVAKRWGKEKAKEFAKESNERWHKIKECSDDKAQKELISSYTYWLGNYVKRLDEEDYLEYILTNFPQY